VGGGGVACEICALCSYNPPLTFERCKYIKLVILMYEC
jgi:hypothetical protein